MPLARIDDHHLSWAQWFADSPVPGRDPRQVVRAAAHASPHAPLEPQPRSTSCTSGWLNGAGMLVWDGVFGVWVGWNERDKGLLRAMLDVQRRHAALLTHGEWTPLAGAERRPAGRRLALGATGARHCGPWRIGIPIRSSAVCRSTAGRCSSSCRRTGSPPSSPTAGSSSRRMGFRPTSRYVRRCVCLRRSPRLFRTGMVDLPPPPPQTAVFRRRETGTYGDAPYVEEWKPLPPRLHDFVAVERPARRAAVRDRRQRGAARRRAAHERDAR